MQQEHGVSPDLERHREELQGARTAPHSPCVRCEVAEAEGGGTVPTMTQSAIEETFKAAIEAAGIPAPPHIIADGTIHRFSTNGKPRNKDGWYVLFVGDPPAGAFGCWHAGIRETWCAGKPETKMTATERAAHAKRIAELREIREYEEDRQHADARKRALAILDKATPVQAGHMYLTQKQIAFEQVRYWLKVDAHHNLLVTVEAPGADLYSVQHIAPNGDKWFLRGGRVKGGFHLISGKGNTNITLLCEGFATGCSVNQATGSEVLVTFTASNLLTVAQALREEDTTGTIVICADNDFHADGKPNTGLLAAQAAAKAVNGILAVPPVLDNSPTDWNDVHCKQGLEAVRQAIEAVLPPTDPTPPERGAPVMSESDTVTDEGNQSKDGEAGSHSTPSAEGAHLHTPSALECDPNILKRFEEVVQERGVVGEVRCAMLIYLMVTSRLLDEPVSGVVKGLSSSGKSFITEMTLKFFPEEALIMMTAMSERALIYMKEEFSHRTLVIYEASALREQREKNESNLTAYFVRSLLSEGRIVYPVTVRDKERGWATTTITKNGPTNVILTTTATELHGENETRLLSIPTNDSQEQTKAIMRRLAEGKSPTFDYAPWHDLQNGLAKLEKRQVTIPYAACLAEKVPPVAVRLRRDFGSVLRLIRAHALLHQCTRKRDDQGHIVATEADYLTVRELVADLISDGVGATVPKTVRETVEIVSEKDKGEGVTVKAVSEHLKLDRSAAHRRIQSARDRGYLVNLEEKRGKPARYAVADPLPDNKELFPLSLSEAVQHTPSECDPSVHSISNGKHEDLSGGVQVRSENGEVNIGESEEEVVADEA